VLNGKWIGRSGVSFGLAALLCLSSCSGAPPKQTYLYVGQVIPPSNDPISWHGAVAQFKVQDDGNLSAVNLPNPNAFTPFYFAVAPSNSFVLASDGQTIHDFQIRSDGTLTGEAPLVPIGGSLAFTPNGRFAIVLDTPNQTLTSYSVAQTGVLTLINAVSASNSSGYIDSPTQTIVDPSGKFAYVNDLYDNTLLGYSLSANGTLAAIGSFPVGGVYPLQLTYSPKGLLYVANVSPGTLAAYSINSSNGSLTPVGTPVSYHGSGLFWMTFDPSGRYAYTGGDLEIQQFKVNASTGTLMPNGVMPLTQEVRAGLVDPSGRFLFATLNDGTVSQFKIGSNGALIPNGSVSLELGSLGQTLSFARR
jgi:6-phosphogluconolactonase (cycloisomerase 2 family)